MVNDINGTLSTARVQENEIVKADDFNFGFTNLIDNIGKFAQMIFECEKNFVIGGKVYIDSGTNIRVEPIFGVCAETKIPFGSTSKSNLLSIEQSETEDRIDLLEVRGVWENYDTQQRAFNDFDTDVITYQQVETKKRLKVEYKIVKGVANSKTAPAAENGYVKLAEIHYIAGTTELSDEDIKNITSDISTLENSEWTNEKDSTYNINRISDVNERFRVEHNEDGSHKNKIIHSQNIDFGINSNQVNASKIPITKKIGDSQANTSIQDTIESELLNIKNSKADSSTVTELNNSLEATNTTIDALEEEVNQELSDIRSSKADSSTVTELENSLNEAVDRIDAAETDIKDKADSSTVNTISNSLTLLQQTVESMEINSETYTNSLYNRYSLYTNTSNAIKVATTDNITLENAQTIDGVSVVAGDLVLVKNQSNAIQNGIYSVNSGAAWARCNALNTYNTLFGKLFLISSGTTNKNKLFYIPQSNFSVGTDKIEFVEYKKLETQALKDLAITTDKLADQSVTTAKLVNGSVTTAKLVNGSVTTAKLADNLTLGGTTTGEFKGPLTGNVTGKISALKENGTAKNFNFVVSGSTLTITTS